MATITREDWHTVADGLRIPVEAIVDGEQRPAADGATFPCVSPIDGRILGDVASCGPADVDAAVRGARAAFESGAWSRLAGGVNAIQRRADGLMLAGADPRRASYALTAE